MRWLLLDTCMMDIIRPDIINGTLVTLSSVVHINGPVDPDELKRPAAKAASPLNVGFFYLIIALASAGVTVGVGYLAMGLIGAFHSGAIGDAKRELSKKDVERIAAASAAANAQREEVDEK